MKRRSKPTPAPRTDPVVDEVRAIRAKLWKQGGGTAAGYLALMRELSAGAKPKTSPARRRKSA